MTLQLWSVEPQHSNDLFNSYPLLPFNLCFGFPIRHMPSLSQTVIRACSGCATSQVQFSVTLPCEL